MTELVQSCGSFATDLSTCVTVTGGYLVERHSVLCVVLNNVKKTLKKLNVCCLEFS